jgi:hypothetical protein
MDLEKELKFSPRTLTRKVGGRIVKQELDYSTVGFGDEDTANLLDGVTESEIVAGRQKLFAENPGLASEQVHDMLDISLSPSEEQEVKRFSDPKQIAAVKKVGKLADRNTGETTNYRHMPNNQIQLSSDEGEILGVFSTREFNDFIDAENLMVL